MKAVSSLFAAVSGYAANKSKRRKGILGRLCIMLGVGLILGVTIVPAQLGTNPQGAPLYGPRPPLGQAPNNSGLPAPLKAVAIEQKLNAQLPLTATFKDETGRTVTLGEFFGKKPVVLALVYYDCPMLCTQVLNGLVGALKQDSFNPGQEFEIVVISFDSRETPEMAQKKKAVYLDRYGRPQTAKGWHFLTGDETNVKAVTETVGFKFFWDDATNQFAHASAIMVVTPEGRLSHYFYGIEYPPRDVHLALTEASGGKIGSAATQLLLYCYHYDPTKGKYGFAIVNIIRLFAIFTIAGVVVLIVVLGRRKNAATT